MEVWLKTPEFSKWLNKSEKKGDAFAFCKVCCVDLYAHRNVIKRHMNSSKHKQLLEIVRSNQNIDKINYLEGSSDIKRAELKFSAFLASHNLPFKLIDKLTPLFPNIFTDSSIAKQMALKRTKATDIVKEALGKNFSKQIYFIL